MRHRRNILDRGDIQSRRLNGADSGLTTCSRPLNSHFHFLHATRYRLASRFLSHHAGGKSRALPRPLNPARPDVLQATTPPLLSEIEIMVLLNVARIWTIPNGTTRPARTRGCRVGRAAPSAPPPAASRAGDPAPSGLRPACSSPFSLTSAIANPTFSSTDVLYVFAAARASFPRTAPTVRRGPLRVRALVLVRWPRTGSPRLWRIPR